ncbi:TPA: DGQHR domain-containing protein [Stenotrophomonas maltophilia]|nr:DGQHR domain-containing protein [Stenotrophomonas maltophilia]
MKKSIPLIRVNQWLRTWDLAEYSERNLPKPADHFFLGSVPISELRRLSGVSRRQVVEDRKPGEGGYQRVHEVERSSKIARYMQWGFPVSSAAGIKPQDHRHLVHPGWLPTAILVNILEPDATRRRHGQEYRLEKENALHINERDGAYELELPVADTRPENALEPLEIIDGQHRIFAMDALNGIDGEYDVPVVFFYGLTNSWQAYLFWVINVEPKKINPSLAFDLYPELRNQSWLEEGENLKVYREHRAQELTEALWRHKESVWRQRIELLGSRIEGHVSNAAFIRTLMATFIRRWGADHRIGGLFGSIKGGGEDRVLPWTRAQQAALLLTIWKAVADEAQNSRADWAVSCRDSYRRIDPDARRRSNPQDLDAAFAGPHTLLATDQGVRAISFVFNAMCQIAYSDIGLEEWEVDTVEETMSDSVVTDALHSLTGNSRAMQFLRGVARGLVSGAMDWRTSKAPGLSEDEKLRQGSYRGSSGYTSLQQECIRALRSAKNAEVSSAADRVADLAGYQ